MRHMSYHDFFLPFYNVSKLVNIYGVSSLWGKAARRLAHTCDESRWSLDPNDTWII